MNHADTLHEFFNRLIQIIKTPTLSTLLSPYENIRIYVDNNLSILNDKYKSTTVLFDNEKKIIGIIATNKDDPNNGIFVANDDNYHKVAKYTNNKFETLTTDDEYIIITANNSMTRFVLPKLFSPVSVDKKKKQDKIQNDRKHMEEIKKNGKQTLIAMKVTADLNNYISGLLNSVDVENITLDDIKNFEKHINNTPPQNLTNQFMNIFLENVFNDKKMNNIKHDVKKYLYDKYKDYINNNSIKEFIKPNHKSSFSLSGDTFKTQTHGGKKKTRRTKQNKNKTNKKRPN
jgi:hypothetical protein